MRANGTEVDVYLRRIAGAAARGAAMGELADNLATGGLIADVTISLEFEQYRYRNTKGWKGLAGVGVSTAVDVGLPTVIGAIGGAIGAGIGASDGAAVGTVVEPGGGTIVGVLAGISVGRMAGIGVGGALGGIMADSVDNLIYGALGG